MRAVVLVCALALVGAPVWCQEGETVPESDAAAEAGVEGYEDVAYTHMERGHPLTDLPPAAPSVLTAFAFATEGGQKRLPIGGEATVLCGFVNTGQSTYNVSMIMGSINAPPPSPFKYYVSNLTEHIINETVGPHTEVSFAYKFAVHPNLEPEEYVLALSVFYSEADDADVVYSSTYYNDTVMMYYASSSWSFKTTARWAGLLGMSGLVAVGMSSAGLCGKRAKVETTRKQEDFLPDSYKKDKDKAKGKPASAKKVRGSPKAKAE